MTKSAAVVLVIGALAGAPSDSHALQTLQTAMLEAEDARARPAICAPADGEAGREGSGAPPLGQGEGAGPRASRRDDAGERLDAAFAPLRQGLKGAPGIQALAVRALGRLECAALVPEIAPLLDSRVPAVRVEAANALGQAALHGDAEPARVLLARRAQTETDPRVLGAIARTLGRLPYHTEAGIREAERTIGAMVKNAVPATPSLTAPSSSDVVRGAAHGLEALARRAVKLGSLSAETRVRLRELARYGLTGTGVTSLPPTPAATANAARARSSAITDPALVRRLAVSALTAARESHVPLLREVLTDPDDQVRRLGILWLGATDDMPLRDDALRPLRGDRSPMVRYEALRVAVRVRRTGETARASAAPGVAGTAPKVSAGEAAAPASGAAERTRHGGGACDAEIAGLADTDAYVSLLAIDLLAQCVDASLVAARLTPLVADLLDPGSVPPASPTPSAVSSSPAPTPPSRAAGVPAQAGWHRAAHALVSLARVAPERAERWLPRAAAHEIWQVRMYAARAAGILNARGTLDTLAVDRADNVRNAAIEALQPLAGHGADAHYLEALRRDDDQLLRTASRALAGTPDKAAAVPALLDAFVRIGAAKRETSRDARVALLDALDAMGRPATTADMSSRLKPFLADFDPVVATRVAALLTAWTGQPHRAAPVPQPRAAVPSPREIERLSRTRATLHMARGGTLSLTLLPGVAPATVARFVRLARARYFDGLTFHRVEPNFVLQGGSPGANEYVGAGPYTRDELDMTSNLRGSVGISTRGRDTGDGQIYVNLVDNVRLDHNYTVFALIADGLPVADGILEGDVIERIELRERP